MYSKLTFKKFRPTLHLARHANEVLLHLIEYIPLGAVATAHVTKVKNKYQCSLEVEGPDGIFIQESISKDPNSALDRVTQKIKIKIQSWQRGHMALSEPSFWEFKEVSND